MILLLICNAFSLQIYDFCNNSLPVYFELSFEPNDHAEIRIPMHVGTFFNQWNNQLLLDIDIMKNNQITKSYGPFDFKKHLIGVYFIDHIYILKFFNDGKDHFSLQMLFNNDSEYIEYYDENDYPIYNYFPIFKFTDENPKLSYFKKHFIYDNDHGGSKKSLIWMGVILSLGCIVFLILNLGHQD